MLYIVGLGLNSKQLTAEGLFALKEASEIYTEGYTSIYSEGSIEELEKTIGKKVKVLYREDVELGLDNIISLAENQIIALCIYGNITSATTHSTIIKECLQKDIEFKLIPGISIFSVIPMLSGLQEYRFGRTVSIVKPVLNYAPTSFFDKIIENRSRELHTICLLDIKIDKDSKYFMQPYEAASRLLEIADEKGTDISDFDTIVVCGACSQNQLVFRTKLGKLKDYISDFDYPSSVIIPGKLTEDENEFVQNLDSF